MASLSDKFPKDTFKSLLKIRAEDLDGTLTPVESGDGVATPLKVSTTSVEIGGVTYPSSGAAPGRVLQVGSNGTSAAWTTPANIVIDYDDLTNKPDFAEVAFSGDYADLINAPTDIAGGGQIQSGSVTLTAASPMVQKVTPTGFNQWVKLPDATTMSAGGVWYMLNNAGSYDLKILDSAGVLQGFVRPNTTVSVGLVDASTSAGSWVFTGARDIGTTVSADLTFPITLSSGRIAQVVVLDSTRELLIFQGTSNIYAVIWNSETGSFSAPFNVRGSTFDFAIRVIAIKTDTNKVLVLSVNSSSLLHANILDTTGSVISIVGTTAQVTIAQASVNLFDIIPVVGQGYAFVYGGGSATVGVRALTITGTTIAIGAENTLSAQSNGANNPPAIWDAGSGKIMAFSCSPSALYARPITMSGTTLTSGTQASVTSTEQMYHARKLQSGRWAVICRNGGTVNGSIITLTGTVAAASTPVALLASTVYAPVAWVKGNQIIVCGDGQGTPFTTNVLTDNNGVGVAGTPIVRNGGPYTSMIGHDADTISVLNTGGVNANGRFFRIGISGNNPVIISAFPIYSVGYDVGGFPLVPPNGNTANNAVFGKNEIHPAVIQGTNSSYAMGGNYSMMWKCNGSVVELEPRMPGSDFVNMSSRCRVGDSIYWTSNYDASTNVQFQRIQVV